MIPGVFMACYIQILNKWTQQVQKEHENEEQNGCHGSDQEEEEDMEQASNGGFHPSQTQ